MVHTSVFLISKSINENCQIVTQFVCEPDMEKCANGYERSFKVFNRFEIFTALRWMERDPHLNSLR